jgi:conjugative transposon TraN protein
MKESKSIHKPISKYMKRLFSFLLLCVAITGNSQTPLPSYRLSIGSQTTTNIIFPYRIEKADIGSGDVVGQKAGTLENVLFIKASRKNFSPTNLSVFTSDGKFYSFILCYKEYPDTLNISFVTGPGKRVYPLSLLTDEKLDSDALLIAVQKTFLNKHRNIQQVKVRLRGIYLQDHLLWFRFEIKNTSDIEYDPEYIKFFIRSKHSTRRTAAQEIEIVPRWQQPKKAISAQSTGTLVFAFPSFTIGRDKKLAVLIAEKNGQREILLAVSANTILHARAIKR